MKKGIKVFGLLLLLALIAASVYLYKAAPIGTGYTSKYVCSYVFTSKQDPGEVMDLFVKPVNILFRFISYNIDYENKEVTAKAFGFLRPKTSFYREGCGCTLMVDVDRTALLDQVKDVHIDRPILRDTLWPFGNKVDLTNVPSNVDQPKLEEVLRKQFRETSEKPSEMTNTMAIVVAYKDRIIAEQYREGITESTSLLSWSASKSITNALIGTLVKTKGLDIHARAPIEEWENDERQQITFDHLLRMESGLKFEEEYVPMADVSEMLYESPSMGDYAASMTMEALPDEKWKYSSGTTNILSTILFDQTGGNLSSLRKFAFENLFNKLGMTSAVFEHDAAGAFVGSSYFYSSAKDWLRFCLLYKNDGVWNGEQILPEGWVDYSLTPTPHAPSGRYGAQIWLNAGEKDNPEDRLYPRLPPDTFFFNGYQGQVFMVIPSKDLMVARFGVTNNDSWNIEDLVLEILSTIDY